MSDKNKKSSLEEAIIDYANIQKFAEEQATAQVKEQVSEKLKNIFEQKLNEDITITISDDDVSVSKDGENVVGLGGIENLEDMPSSDMGLENPEGDENLDDEFSVSDEDDEISITDNMDESNFDYEKDGVKYSKDYLPEPPSEINLAIDENMEEMNNMPAEQGATPAAAPAIDAPVQAPTDAAPVVDMTEETPGIPEMISKLDTLINVMMQQQGGADVNAEATPGEEEFEVIDDEASAPAPAPAAAPVAPMQEEEIEIEDFENDMNHKSFIEEMENDMVDIVDEDEVPMDGMPVDETRSLGFTSKRTGDKNLKMTNMKDASGHHAPVTSLKENKAQQESKLGELIKENNSLKSTVKDLQSDRKEFEDAFRELRKQFNEMQTFNGKLALVNKVLMNGGLTTDEKVKICEQFDQTETFDEANKLFKNIMKENSVKTINNVADKLKSTSTNTAKAKSTSEPLYESDEAKRLKRLAGIIKSEDEN